MNTISTFFIGGKFCFLCVLYKLIGKGELATQQARQVIGKDIVRAFQASLVRAMERA